MRKEVMVAEGPEVENRPWTPRRITRVVAGLGALVLAPIAAHALNNNRASSLTPIVSPRLPGILEKELYSKPPAIDSVNAAANGAVLIHIANTAINSNVAKTLDANFAAQPTVFQSSPNESQTEGKIEWINKLSGEAELMLSPSK